MFTHILPDKYRKALYKKATHSPYVGHGLEEHHNRTPTLFDVQLRLHNMEKHPGLRQVLTIMAPALELVTRPHDAVELAKLANEEVAKLVQKYPQQFIAGVACLPMGDPDAAVREAERAVRDLKMKGVQIYTPCNGKALDSPEFFPLYELMTKYDLPIWLHPTKDGNTPDYAGEDSSTYNMFMSVGWPYETTVGLARLVQSGTMEKYPSLKIIAHHCGGMVPYVAGRLLRTGRPESGQAAQRNVNPSLPRPLGEYYRMFYGDTALVGYTPSLMCGLAFFGTDHVVFGTDDMTGDPAREIITIEEAPLPDSDKVKIFETNAKRLMHI